MDRNILKGGLGNANKRISVIEGIR